MSSPFGSKEMTEFGFMLDGLKYAPCTRLPLILVDSRLICGRRLILGAADPAEATQVLISLTITSQNVTAAIEAPRFKLFLNSTIGIEGKKKPLKKLSQFFFFRFFFPVNHSPKFSDDVLHYLSGFERVVSLSEPYDSCNIVAKTNDELSSHSDSRGGGIASRF